MKLRLLMSPTLGGQIYRAAVLHPIWREVAEHCAALAVRRYGRKMAYGEDLRSICAEIFAPDPQPDRPDSGPAARSARGGGTSRRMARSSAADEPTLASRIPAATDIAAAESTSASSFDEDRRRLAEALRAMHSAQVVMAEVVSDVVDRVNRLDVDEPGLTLHVVEPFLRFQREMSHLGDLLVQLGVEPAMTVGLPADSGAQFSTDGEHFEPASRTRAAVEANTMPGIGGSGAYVASTAPSNASVGHHS